MADVFRQVYEPLSDDQKAHILSTKDTAESLLAIWDEVVPPSARSERSRCLAIARTNLEQAIMWAVKGLATKGE